MGWGHWERYTYVTKAEKMRRAEKAKAALRKKKGIFLEPVEVAGREIARTWWGKSWNQNLERYADYSNRLPRGRTYVRSGAVLDLKIAPNTIVALVSGSRAQPYKIGIHLHPLDKKNEQALMAKSRASLDSMQALLSGDFPSELKELFFAQGTGLFPVPHEIEFSCSCPDWASMCKHVAAALYGTSVRLDEKPELFFVLRGIRMEDFVGEMVKQESKKLLRRAKAKGERVIAANEGELSELFGITMDGAPDKPAAKPELPAPPTVPRQDQRASGRKPARPFKKSEKNLKKKTVAKSKKPRARKLP